MVVSMFVLLFCRALQKRSTDYRDDGLMFASKDKQASVAVTKGELSGSTTTNKIID